MSYAQAREVARIRQELRERLMSDRAEDVSDLLASLRGYVAVESELRGEYERWKLRFELLGGCGPSSSPGRAEPDGAPTSATAAA